MRGFTLIELMISLVIGMLVVLAVMTSTLGTRQTAVHQEDVLQIQEGARFAFDRMRQHLRIAGFIWNPTPNTTPTSDDSEFVAPGNGSSCFSARHAICGINDGGAGLNDELIVRFYGMSTPGDPPPVTPDNSIRDCAGVAHNATTLVEERYRVETVNGVPTLMCYVVTGANVGLAAMPAGTPGIALVTGVQRMQVLYGYDTNAVNRQGGLIATQWGPANANRMDTAMAVRVALLLQSAFPTSTTTDTATYNFFGPDYPLAGDAGAQLANPGDYRVRKLVSFSSHIGVR